MSCTTGSAIQSCDTGQWIPCFKSCQKRGEVWRHVTMVALFLDDNKTNDDGDGKESGKNNIFILKNNNFARASRYFAHSFAVVAPLRHETS